MSLPTLFQLETFTGGNNDEEDILGPVRPHKISLKTVETEEDFYPLLTIDAYVKGESQKLSISDPPPQMGMAWETIKRYLLNRFICPEEEADWDEFLLTSLSITYGKTPKLTAVLQQQHQWLTSPIEHKLKAMKFEWSTTDDPTSFHLPLDLVQQILILVRYSRQLFQESPCHLDLLRKVTSHEFAQLVEQFQTEALQISLVPEEERPQLEPTPDQGSSKKKSTRSRSRKDSSNTST